MLRVKKNSYKLVTENLQVNEITWQMEVQTEGK